MNVIRHPLAVLHLVCGEGQVRIGGHVRERHSWCVQPTASPPLFAGPQKLRLRIVIALACSGLHASIDIAKPGSERGRRRSRAVTRPGRHRQSQKKTLTVVGRVRRRRVGTLARATTGPRRALSSAPCAGWSLALPSMVGLTRPTRVGG